MFVYLLILKKPEEKKYELILSTHFFLVNFFEFC